MFRGKYRYKALRYKILCPRPCLNMLEKTINIATLISVWNRMRSPLFSSNHLSPLVSNWVTWNICEKVSKDANSVIERRFYSRPFCQIVSSLFFPPCIHLQKIIYSYFEKGYWKKCRRQSRKVLWVRFWVHCSWKKFARMARETINLCLRLLKKSGKSNFGSYSVRNSVLIISYLPFGIVACTFFPTTFFEVAVPPPVSNIQIIECTFILNWAEKKIETQHVHLIPVLLWQTKCWWVPPYCGIQQGWILRQTDGNGYVLGKKSQDNCR